MSISSVLDAAMNGVEKTVIKFSPKFDYSNMTSSSSSSENDDPFSIRAGAKFDSFKRFEAAFEKWKAQHCHPFRVASSETLRMPDGTTNDLFKYRYIVYHCAHYGSPRMRGAGKRPNQNYMPCGCKAMLRLNYSWTENCLRITTLNEQHTGHETSPEAFGKFSSKVKRFCSAPAGLQQSNFDDPKQSIQNLANNVLDFTTRRLVFDQQSSLKSDILKPLDHNRPHCATGLVATQAPSSDAMMSSLINESSSMGSRCSQSAMPIDLVTSRSMKNDVILPSIDSTPKLPLNMMTSPLMVNALAVQQMLQQQSTSGASVERFALINGLLAETARYLLTLAQNGGDFERKWLELSNFLTFWRLDIKKMLFR